MLTFPRPHSSKWGRQDSDPSSRAGLFSNIHHGRMWGPSFITEHSTHIKVHVIVRRASGHSLEQTELPSLHRSQSRGLPNASVWVSPIVRVNRHSASPQSSSGLKIFCLPSQAWVLLVLTLSPILHGRNQYCSYGGGNE